MSKHAFRLPARPSLEQFRKQAKDLLRQFRLGDTAATERFCGVIPRLTGYRPGELALADAQFVLAREYGFDSWAKLVRHVEDVRESGRLEQFDRLASDYLSGYAGDLDALQRLITHFGVSYTPSRLHESIRERLRKLPGVSGDPALADIQSMIARQYGFEHWAGLAEGLAQPPDDARSVRLGLSSAPPFYRIDARSNTMEPQPPLSDGDWDTIFGVMKEMEITGISAACMTDRAMERLSRLDFVTHLNVGGARQLTDEGLRHLANMPQIEELELGGYQSPLTDLGLQPLRHLNDLRAFQCCWSQRVTDVGMANLAFCDHLERVNLLGTPTGDGAIKALIGKRRLHNFSAGKCVSDTGLPLLHQFPMFKTWKGGETRFGMTSFEAEPTHLLLDGPFTDKGFASIGALDGLAGLSFFWHASVLTPEGLKPLADLPNLEFLGCQGSLCNDATMSIIASAPRLRMLMGQGAVAGDAGWAALSRSRTMEYIWGRDCPNLTGRGFAALATMPALRGLAVNCANVDDAALSALPRFPALRELAPMNVLDEGFRHVGRCMQLEKLTCMYCRDTGDAATEHITGLSRLKAYFAGQTQITDRSLELLGGMTSLEDVTLSGCAGISDAGLVHIARLPRLKKVAVDATARVSRGGIAVFPANVHVDFWT